jgi:capsular polysaccharide biosynthesis protein
VNDRDQTATWPAGIGDDLPEPLSAYDMPLDIDERSPGTATARLVSLGFIWAALRRRARLWCTLAVVGVLIGVSYYTVFEHTYRATVSVLLADSPTEQPASQILTDMTLAQSVPVATGVIKQLGLSQTPSAFLGTYTVTQVTDEVLLITASAPNSQQATERASALATQFLKFRAQYGEIQQQETNAQLEQQVNQAQQHVNSINKQISQASSQSASSSQQSQLGSLQAQKTTASNTLSAVQTYATQTKASTETTTQQVIAGSVVLNAAAPVKSSFKKNALLYGVGGLFGGLVLGMIIVIIGAVISDRLRRRDDIAYAFGAPVRLSVGPVRKSRWWPELPGSAATRGRRVDQVVEHLRNMVPESPNGAACLAIVAVDDERTVAKAVAELAVSSAKRQRRVVLADLSVGARAARLLGVDHPGTDAVSPDGTHIVVVVPEATDVAPVGPLRDHASTGGRPVADETLGKAYAHADLVLSLVTLDPAAGGEHLATWATDAVVVVTAGRSTEVKIHAVGEMIRLAGVRLSSLVVVDADKSDESLGVITPAYNPIAL